MFKKDHALSRFAQLLLYLINIATPACRLAAKPKLGDVRLQD
ncbi:MAG: hypothetical protein ABW092_11375 [Candidatus Thiodiazotropha sp.]